MLAASVLRWYAEDTTRTRWNTVVNINRGQSKVSLRALDWLATNLSKCSKVTYYVRKRPFDLHASYKSCLNAYKKANFDPFRRGPRFYFDGKKARPDWTGREDRAAYETTIGQLNFFWWAITNGVLHWAQKNINHILNDMNMPKRRSASNSLRRPLRAPDRTPCLRYNHNTVISITTVPAPNPFSMRKRNHSPLTNDRINDKASAK